MAQNLVIPDKDNRVVLVFGGIVLADSTNITMDFGSEVFSTTGGTPKLVILPATVDDPERLSCDLSGTAEVGKIFATVTYFDGTSVNGTDITSRELNNLDQIIVAVGSQLIIEDGTIVANANSLTTDAEFLAWASIRGKSVPATEPERDALQIAAMAFITSKEARLKGCRVDKLQTLPYPRRGLCVNNFEIDDDEIPVNAKQAQLELSIQAKDSPLLITETINNLQSFEVVGAYKEEYFSGGAWANVRTDAADVYLNPLLINGGNNNIAGRV